MNNDSKTTNSSKLLSSEERRLEFIKMGWWVSIPLSVIPSKWIYEGDFRLDGGFYTAEVTAAMRAVYESGHEVRNISAVTKRIDYPTRFKRVYTRTQENGIPFLTASEMLQFRPESNEFLTKSLVKSADCMVPEGSILVTRSGSVGRCVIVGKRLHKFAITDDAFRVQADSIKTGYLYAFMSCWIGQTLITKDEYGSAIKHLEPHQLSSVPIPILPEDEENQIHEQIIRAFELREQANELLDKATALLYLRLGLKQFPLSEVPYLPASKESNSVSHIIPHPQAFTILSSTLKNRFDASFHVPTANLAADILSHLSCPVMKLGNVVQGIFLPNRFKRVYVQKAYGIPFLQGSHLPQNILYDLKYISKKVNGKNINQCLIHPGYILITRSGTIGITSLVSSLRDGWGASEHLLRIVPNSNIAHPGFITLYMMTPYGQYQVKSKIYGGVVDEVTAEDLADVVLPLPSIEIQKEIGELVTESFELKDFATKLEMEAVESLEKGLTKNLAQY